MEGVDFSKMPLGERDGVRIAICPKCGRHGRVVPRPGGGRMYDHVTQPLEPAVAGCHEDIVDWCEVAQPMEHEDGPSPGRGSGPLLPR